VITANFSYVNISTMWCCVMCDVPLHATIDAAATDSLVSFKLTMYSNSIVIDVTTDYMTAIYTICCQQPMRLVCG
jgi:hypothetical protein